MEAFLIRHKGGHWSIRLITRYTIKTVLKELTGRDHKFICYDPHEDGTGGHSVRDDLRSTYPKRATERRAGGDHRFTSHAGKGSSPLEMMATSTCIFQLIRRTSPMNQRRKI
jgi:hypothetical protein